MDSKRFATVAIAAAAFTIASTGVAPAQIEIEVIAATDTPIPGGMTLVNLGPPVIGDGGTMAFVTGVAGPSVGPGNDTAIVVTNSKGNLEVIAPEGGPAPGGGFYFSFGDVDVNGDAAVLYIADVMNGTLESGFFVSQDNDPVLIINSNNALCNAPPGVTIAPGNISFPSLSDLHVNGDSWSCSATLDGPGVTFNNDQAIIGGSLSEGGACIFARKGDEASNTGATIGFLGGHTLGALGDVTFDAFLTGPGVTPANEQATFRTDKSGNLTNGPRTGNIAPGTGGLAYKNINLLSQNNSGEVVFTAGLEATTPTQGIFLGPLNDLKLLVRSGDIDSATGGKFATLGARVDLSGAGEVLFDAVLEDGRRGIWTGRSGDIRLVAIRGDSAPGIPGTTFTTTFFIHRINSLDNIIFGALITGPGIDTSNDEVLYAVGSDGSLELVMHEGAPFNVPPNDPRAVTNAVKTVAGFDLAGGGLPSGGEDGRPSALSAGGQVAFRLSFTDGTEAIVVGPPEARPVTLMAGRPVEGSRTTLVAPTGFKKKPVVIAGPATAADKKQGVVRLRKIKKDGTFQAEFDRWTKGKHGQERLSFLLMPKGRQKIDGTTWEAGTLKLKGNRNWGKKKFKKKFKGTPELFLTLQTSKDKAPATVRARNVTKKGFEAALQEAEKSLGGGHKKETVGYVAVYGKKNKGSLSGGIGGTPYGLATPKVNHKSKKVLGERLRLEEEKSKDKETKHKQEGEGLGHDPGPGLLRPAGDRQGDRHHHPAPALDFGA